MTRPVKILKTLKFESIMRFRSYTNRLRAGRLCYGTNLKLHLGCGEVVKKGWVNIDLYDKHADLILDLRGRMPFSNDSCSVIYNEHFLEHIDYPDEALFFLKECCRILKPGGTLNIGVPDTEWPIRAYVEKDKEDYFRYAKQIWHPKWCVTKMDHINCHFRDGGRHKYAYDFETLEHALRQSGFREVTRRDFDPEMDSELRKLGTLYVEAVKPGAASKNSG